MLQKQLYKKWEDELIAEPLHFFFIVNSNEVQGKLIL
jgi:hypothetical protein